MSEARVQGHPGAGGLSAAETGWGPSNLWVFPWNQPRNLSPLWETLGQTLENEGEAISQHVWDFSKGETGKMGGDTESEGVKGPRVAWGKVPLLAVLSFPTCIVRGCDRVTGAGPAGGPKALLPQAVGGLPSSLSRPPGAPSQAGARQRRPATRG